MNKNELMPEGLAEHPSVSKVFGRLKKVLNIHKAIAVSPLVFGHFISFAHALRNETNIDPRERELGILCVLERHHGSYELHHHRRMARDLGASEAQVKNVCTPERCEEFSDRERSILGFAQKFADDPRGYEGSEQDDLLRFLDKRQLVELSFTLALYLGIAHFTEILSIPIDGEE